MRGILQHKSTRTAAEQSQYYYSTRLFVVPRVSGPDIALLRTNMYQERGCPYTARPEASATIYRPLHVNYAIAEQEVLSPGQEELSNTESSNLRIGWALVNEIP